MNFRICILLQTNDIISNFYEYVRKMMCGHRRESCYQTT